MKRKTCEEVRVFVSTPSGKNYYCSDCIPERLRERLGDDRVQVWEEFSDGWIGQPKCITCKLSIPVYVDGRVGK